MPRELPQGICISSILGYTLPMSIHLPLKDMTLQEKLAVMESLWEDISKTPDAIESPAWHKDVLEERRQNIAKGEAKFSDWETAKADIRKRLS